MIKKFYILFLFFIGLSFCSTAQQTPKINWMTWEQVIEKNKSEPHMILIHIFTEGCTPCKNMDLTTFATANVISLINDNFYAVKLDARSKKDLGFNGKKLGYKCENGTCYHELAMELTNGSLSFPSVVFLDAGLNTIGAIPDYKDPVQFALYVEYYGHGYSKKMTFHRFVEYKKKFK